MDYTALVRAVALEHGCIPIFAFLQNQDVVISLPDYYKSLCYSLLPPIHDKLRKVENKSIVTDLRKL